MDKIIKHSMLEPLLVFKTPTNPKARKINFSKWGWPVEYWLHDIQDGEIPQELVRQTEIAVLEIAKALPNHAIEYKIQTKDGSYHESIKFIRSYHIH